MSLKFIQFKSYKPYNFSTMVNGTRVRLHVRYNSYLDKYYFNVDKQIGGIYENVLNSVMLTTGVDLFMQHPQLFLGEMYIIPLITDLYDKDPSASTIQNYMMMWDTGE